MLPLDANRIEHFARNWIVFGFFVYFGCFFLLNLGGMIIPFLIFVVFPVLILCVVSRFRCVHDKYAVFVCAAFLGYFSLSALWGEGSFFNALKYSLCILCLMLSVENVSQKVSEDAMMKSIIVIGLIAAISFTMAILLSSRDLMTFMTGRFSFFDIAGWGRKNPIHSGIAIGVPVIAAWYFFPGKRWYVQLMLIVTVMLGAMLLLVTKSRGPMLAAAITLLCITLYRREKSDFLLLFLFAILAGLLLLNVDSVNNSVVNRFEEKDYRLIIWRSGLDLFMDHWLFGQGYGTNARITTEWSFSHAHNTIIDTLRIGGVIGGVLFIYMLGAMIRLSRIHSGNIFYLFWLLFGMLSLFTNGRLPLRNPGGMEFYGFWLPLFLFYYMKKRPDLPSANASITQEKAE